MDKIEITCHACAKETPHTFFGEKGEYNEIYLIDCEVCHCKQEMPRKQWMFETTFKNAEKTKKAYLDKWPRICPYSGSEIKSREHQAEVLTRMGYYRAPHGVDSRYDHVDSKYRRDISDD